MTEEIVTAPQTEIEARLSGLEPEVEVLLAEIRGPSTPTPTLRLFIDHPEGVTLALCERVTAHLDDYRERYSVEVSSPGQDRPLTKPQHFSRFLGRRARVRLREQAAVEGRAGGQRQVTGELVGVSDTEVTLAAADGLVTVPYGQIARSNLIPGD
jgi:ribosome maturation factor RimP